ncbi:glycoside hydrolase family 99-like domain-containing protein [Enterococcus gallinarum]|uniref:glycosyltransferase WbsX family protein n=1 Tax=Enterococcus gallinarum TaxID=1353 RepID=UPI00214D0171|nr:glycoside hydrolase family 99-like domain-containing protein [Enterococcus gallinarum]MCR1927173.1 glycoside hydrolase family 99-like domain-containing protein [Enterococcus gallinarum]
MKYIAYYLPQFHEIPENNEWWGNGFTEWTNVKNAKKLFQNHYQPRIPLNNNFYNLLNKETLEWQAALANKYNVYGFCFYHYWFKDSKKLLEKPAEILLDHPSIDMNYCFSWANEPWTRSWDGKSGEIIMEQDYGDKRDWKNHFDYLVPFFKDKRYIKIDGKPVFIIYKPDSSPKIEQMMNYWNQLCEIEGIQKIYFIRTLRSRKINGNDEIFSAAVEFEPAYTNYNLPLYERTIRKGYNLFCSNIKSNNKLKLMKYDYKKVTQKSLKKRPITSSKIKTIPGIFVNWDNTPRKGANGIVFKNFNLKNFENYLYEKSLIARDLYKSDMLFINAWNEWAEGTYLEPDDKYGFGYLETIKKVFKQVKDEE